MSDRIEVPSNESGVVRLFAVDLPAEDIEDFAEASSDGWPLITALGVMDLNPSYVEIFPVNQLDEMGLHAYLTEAYNIDPEDLRDDRTVLNNVRGNVALISSRAFRGKAQTLRLRHPMRWLGTWSEPRPELDLGPIPSKAAKGTTGDIGPANQKGFRMSRKMRLILAFIGFALGLVIFYLTRI